MTYEIIEVTDSAIMQSVSISVSGHYCAVGLSVFCIE